MMTRLQHDFNGFFQRIRFVQRGDDDGGTREFFHNIVAFQKIRHDPASCCRPLPMSVQN
ncbi:hypothetical protein SDC9_168338 [bioreactor metagenome]|uniref:Uncharacterized protein n=1 Tax=bioreactor metagenome TaxID=1076179 RepID=A0A645G590_9ZZZZ